MKKILFTIVFAVSISMIHAQDSTSLTKVYHNEFGIDVTGFLKQFFNFNQGQGSSSYYPVYYLTYRRHFTKGNIRFAIGGDFENRDIPPTNDDDKNIYRDKSYSLDLRLGWEFFNDISKRWQVFYGLDFISSSYHTKNDVQYFSGDYAYGSETKAQTFGLAPLLGFRYKITNRLSISTQTSFSINWQKNNSKRYFTPIFDFIPPRDDDKKPESKRVFSNYSQPLSLFLTFDI